MSSRAVTGTEATNGSKPVEQNQLGATLCRRAEEIYQRSVFVKNLVQEGRNQPARLSCSLMSLFGGVSYMATMTPQGLTAGGYAAAMGLKELFNMGNGAGHQYLDRLLSDIQADVGMAATLNEANVQSIKSAQASLTEAQEGVEALQGQFQDIQNINVQGMQEVQKKKDDAGYYNRRAKETFEEAKGHFEKAKQKMLESQQHTGNAGGYFKEFHDLLKDEKSKLKPEEKIARLIEISKDAYDNSQLAMKDVEAGLKSQDEGLKKLKEAFSFKEKASSAMAEALATSKAVMQASVEKAAISSDCNDKIKKANDELSSVLERCNEIMGLLEQMKEDLEEAREVARSLFTLGEFTAGAGAAALLSPYMWLPYALAAGGCSAYAWRHGKGIKETASEVYCYFRGFKKVEPNPMQDKEMVRFYFDDSSSGYFGYYVMRRSSVTVGDLKINLGGGKELTFRFNLNDRNRISKSDLLSLYGTLTKNLQAGTLSSERCLAVLDELEKIKIERAEGQKAVEGFIDPKQASYVLFKMLKKACQGTLPKEAPRDTSLMAG